MGGSNYDRDVYSSSSSYGWESSRSSNIGASSYSASRFTQTTLSPVLNPVNKVLESKTKHPIIVVLDVTGSNIEFAGLVYDKMPMFYGQIEQQGYLDDFDISFCAVGDAYVDDYPLQVGNFATGIVLDSILEKIVLEGGGGGQKMESYELAAYYLYKNTKFIPGSEPIIFFLGDEAPYSRLNVQQAKQFGAECNESGVDPFGLLRKKANDNVFLLLSKYCGKEFRSEITNSWTKLLATEHVIKVKEDKSVVDLMLGIIAMVSMSRTLESYKDDMRDRDQTPERIKSVSEALKDLETVFNIVRGEGASSETQSTVKSTQKGKRL